MAKSTTGHLYRCYAWLVDTIDQYQKGISFEEISKLWGADREVNDDKENYLVEPLINGLEAVTLTKRK